MDSRTFEGQMRRIREVTGKRTQAELADFLGVRQSSISDATRRGKIPADWLVILLRTKDVCPEWILTGLGPCFIHDPAPEADDTGEMIRERRDQEDALRRLPSRALADELVRRIALAQADGFTRKKPGISS